ncbi:Sec-independent protein translocase protein TatC [Alcanivorax sp. ALC70]|nr:Sec-independent protein translocase protein TatC [Alcanivorax sp. ALC70]
MEKLSASRAYVVVGCFVIGMLLTPPDIVSQTLLAVPMWLLFEIGLIFGRLVRRQQVERQEQEDAGDQD